MFQFTWVVSFVAEDFTCLGISIVVLALQWFSILLLISDACLLASLEFLASAGKKIN